MTRDVAYRVDVVRNGAPVTQLQFAADDGPQIVNNRDTAIHGSLKGTFLPNDEAKLESDELRPWIIINGEEYPLGVYQAATVNTRGSETDRRIEIEAYDRCWRLYAQKTETIIHLAAGSSYLTTIRKMLTACGVTLVLATPSTETLSTDREDWDIGTPYLTIINDLLDEINYKSVYFDLDGVCHLEPYQEPRASAIAWRYGTTDVFGPAAHPSPDWADETDLFNAPNVFVVICNNPDQDGVMSATATNNNPASSKSIFRRKLRITSVTRVSNIASQAELQAYADKLRNESMMAARAITFYTLAEPGHGTGDILALTHEHIGGIYVESGWALTMTPGELMTHTAKRTVIA